MQKPTKFALVVNLKAAKALMPKTLSVGEGAVSYIKANDRNVRRAPAVAQREPFGTREGRARVAGNASRVLAQTRCSGLSSSWARRFDWLARW